MVSRHRRYIKYFVPGLHVNPVTFAVVNDRSAATDILNHFYSRADPSVDRRWKISYLPKVPYAPLNHPRTLQADHPIWSVALTIQPVYSLSDRFSALAPPPELNPSDKILSLHLCDEDKVQFFIQRCSGLSSVLTSCRVVSDHPSDDPEIIPSREEEGIWSTCNSDSCLTPPRSPKTSSTRFDNMGSFIDFRVHFGTQGASG